MIEYCNAETATAFKKWLSAAIDAAQACKLADNARHRAIYHGNDGKRNEAMSIEARNLWGGSFQRQVLCWMTRPDFADCVVVVLARQFETDLHGERWCRDFDFAVYRRDVDEYGQWGERKFWYNGGFINHGTITEPRWQTHT